MAVVVRGAGALGGFRPWASGGGAGFGKAEASGRAPWGGVWGFVDAGEWGRVNCLIRASVRGGIRVYAPPCVR